MTRPYRLQVSFILALFITQGFALEKLEDSAALPLEHRGLSVLPPGEGNSIGASGPASRLGSNSDELWPLTSPTDLPQIKNLQVQCEKTHMRVNIEFDRPFYGMIFSKGHYSDAACIHARPGSGQLSTTFDIYLNSCGMTSSASQGNGQPSPAGAFVENTIIIQYDPLVQEVWDQARRLRCTWYDYYEKSVTFRPFAVDMLNAVTANFLGDNLQCWMQIQVGKGPWASEVSGIVKIGQTMTMVLAIQDDDNKFDMLVRNCVAHDGIRSPIQLVDQNGCVIRPKIMSKFQKVKNFGPSASVVSYAYFQAFKFPDSMNVHFQCVIQVCRYNCPEPRCDGLQGSDSLDTNFAASSTVLEPRVPPAATASAQQAAKPLKTPKAAPAAITGQRPVPFNTVNREGVAKNTDEKLDNLLFGKPRASSDAMTLVPRPKRSASEKVLHVYRRDAQDMTDVKTARIIQVVSPGDVAFTLNLNQNETVVVQSVRDYDFNKICLSTPSFVGGLTMMLLVFVVACMVATFLLLRVRHFNKKNASSVASLVAEKTEKSTLN